MTFEHSGGRLALGAAVFLGAIGGLIAPAAAQESDIETTAALFGARETVLDISLSPSGTKIAFIAAGPEHTEHLNVIDLAGDTEIKRVIVNSEKIADLDWCEWANDTRLVCQVSAMAQGGDGFLLPFDRLFSIDADGGNVQELSKRDSPRALGFAQQGGDVLALDAGGEQGQILMSREWVAESELGTRIASRDSGLGVDLVDVVSGKRRILERADPAAQRYVADEAGQVRIKMRARFDGNGRLTGEYDYFFRTPDSNNWKSLDNLTIDGKSVPWFSPLSVDSNRNVAVGFVRIGGYDAIAEFVLDSSGAGKVVMARDDVDVDALIRIGRKRRVVGGS